MVAPRAPLHHPFSGSYAPEDCEFLLKTIQPPADVPVEEKERLIQTGRKHYSEMLTHEHRPSARYRDLFLAQTARHKARLAQDIVNLAETIRTTYPAPVTLVSLARAGTPIGALLQRVLNHQLGVPSRHFSISIIRDRGIDEQALTYILRVAKRPPEGVVFIDGWTAKGVIAAQLRKSIASWNRHQPELLVGRLHVIADLGSVADVAATADDYLIPSAILGAAVSGLVSRSILNEQIAATDFHGCVFYEHLRAYDYSSWFLDTLSREMETLVPRVLPRLNQAECHLKRKHYLARLRRDYNISNINYIKPGVLEATRVLLRRVPALLLLAEADSSDVTHLQLLAAEKGVPVHYDGKMPFRGVALIKTF